MLTLISILLGLNAFLLICICWNTSDMARQLNELDPRTAPRDPWW